MRECYIFSFICVWKHLLTLLFTTVVSRSNHRRFSELLGLSVLLTVQSPVLATTCKELEEEVGKCGVIALTYTANWECALKDTRRKRRHPVTTVGGGQLSGQY